MTKRFLTPLSTDHIDFNLSNPSTDSEGRLRWDAANGTLSLGMAGGVVQQIGEEFFVTKVLNKSGVAIPNGSFVMATGAQGDQITIAKAVTNGSVDPMYMLGIATEDIAIGAATGRVTMYGVVRDIDTSLWNVGTVLYPDQLVPGGLTSTQPSAPNIRTPIAIVIRKHANTGRIYVRMTNGSVLGGTDSNVKIDNPQQGDVLTYNATNSIWENTQVTQNLVVSSGSEYPTGSVVNGQLFYNTTTGNTAIYFNSIWKEFAYATTNAALDGGTPFTTSFDSVIDGGTNSTTVFVNPYDGGTP